MAPPNESSDGAVDWPAPPLKHVANLIAGATPSTTDSKNWTSGNDGVAWVTIGDMTRNDPVVDTERRVTLEGIAASGLQVSPPGTLLLSMYASLGELAETAVEACWNQAILGVFPRPDEFETRFLKYALIASRPVLCEQARSNTQANLNAEQVANTRVSRPPLDEQRRIADFLDVETDGIDELVRLKRELFARLPERVTAVIHEAIADFPRNARLSYVVSWRSGGTPPKGEHEHWCGDLPWASTKDLVRDELCDTVDHITEAAAADHSCVVPAGSLLVATRGMALAKRLPLAVTTRRTAFNQDLKALVPGSGLQSAYLRVVLRGLESDILANVVEAAHGTRRLETRWLKALRVPVPERQVQRATVERVRAIEEQNDAVASRLARQVALLTERREALITAAVTGQLSPTSRHAAGLTA